ncbi:MAG: hypothetical protein GX088_05960 [Clostridia bacterium]|nr:hypothetical protein [Clostridia bacterium]
MKENFKVKKSIFLTFFLFAAVIAAIIFGTLPAWTEEKGAFTKSGRKAIIVVTDRLSLSDISPELMPNINKIIEEGALGLMNTKTLGVRGTANAYATLGAGKQALSHDSAALSFNSQSVVEDIPVSEQYEARIGKKAPSEGVVCLGLPHIKYSNEKAGVSGVGPGLLGEQLHTYGLKTAVLGNADIKDEFHREAATIAMDSWGRVDFGDVSRNLTEWKPDGLTLYRTNYDALLETFQKIYPAADLIVVETGDLYRIDLNSDRALPEVIKKEKAEAIKRVDEFVGNLLKTIDIDNTLLLIVSPCPSKEDIKNNHLLTPIVMYGDIEGRGTLTSGTTRRNGIVSNADVAPTLLNYLGLPVPAEMTGRPMEVLKAENALGTLSQVNNDHVFVYTARPILVKGYVVLQIIVMLLIMAILLLNPGLLYITRPLLLWLMAVPLGLLLIPLFRFLPLPLYALGAALIAFIVVSAAYLCWKKEDVNLFMIIGLATALAVLLDVLAGSPLMTYSTLGFDAMAGARYYGLGNEYMGVLLGASIIGTASLWEKYRGVPPLRIKVFTALFFFLTLLLTGYPRFGSNVGGTIAVAAGYLFTFLFLLDVRIGFRQIAAIAGAVAASVVLLAFIDMSRSVEAQSHLGRAVNMLLEGGLSAAWDIIYRKVNMNLKLIRYTIWSRVFLTLLGALAVAFYRPVGLMNRVREKYPYIFKGLLGILVGSGFALLANDSGIVAAATSMIFGTAPLIYLVNRVYEDTKRS